MRAVGLVLLLAGCQLVRVDPPGTTPPEDVASDELQEFAQQVNRYRQQAGCPVLQWDANIAAVAQKHSREMAQYRYLSHTNRAGQSPFDRLSAARINFRMAAENIAAGPRTPEAVLAGWINSEGHRRNLRECRYTHQGAAMADFYWTHVFVRY